MFRVSPLAFGACARAQPGNSDTRLAAISVRRLTPTVVSSQRLQPLKGTLAGQLIASTWRRIAGIVKQLSKANTMRPGGHRHSRPLISEPLGSAGDVIVDRIGDDA